jgi:hypothetical protein
VNIGKEAEEPVEYPEPVAPGQQPVHEPSPVVEPAREPAHAEVLDRELVLVKMARKYVNG